MAKYDPLLEGMINEARAVTCEEWLIRQDHRKLMKRAGANIAGPCPKCGGDDRFGVDLGQDKWICRNCGVGGNDAISMVVLLWPLKGATHGECFIEACELITGRTRTELMSEEEAKRRADDMALKKKRQNDESEKRRLEAREAAYRTWKRGYPAGKHVADYFKIRGIETDVSKLDRIVREVPDLPYWHEGKVLHTGPAMVAVIQWSDDRFGGVHRTWLDPVNGKKGKAIILNADQSEALDVKKAMGSLGDGAIRLVTPPGAYRMVMGEGIETTLSPYVHAFDPDTAYWCGVSLGHIAGRAARDPTTHKPIQDQPDMEDRKCFLVPEWVRELTLLADGDSDPKKTKASLKRAARRFKRQRPGLVVKIAWPGIKGDFNDLAMAQREEVSE